MSSVTPSTGRTDGDRSDSGRAAGTRTDAGPVPQAAPDAGAARRRRRLITGLKESLRELSIQLSLLNHQVGARVEVRATDFACLDLINRYGPLSPSALARRAGLHPATMTGIIDRLERGGWIVRERDSTDRRAVAVRALRDRNAELFQLYSGMNASMDQILAGYDEAELELLADFLHRTTRAGLTATDELTGGAGSDVSSPDRPRRPASRPPAR